MKNYAGSRAVVQNTTSVPLAGSELHPVQALQAAQAQAQEIQSATIGNDQQIAGEGLKGSGSGIPYLSEMERAFGTSFGDITAHTISSGGDPKKKANGQNYTTWNFHWGGVILKSTSGSDNVTLENYAGSKKTDWVSQMYGVPTKDHARKGQTFQEQHRDDHRQHGETPTTMSTEKS